MSQNLVKFIVTVVLSCSPVNLVFAQPSVSTIPEMGDLPFSNLEPLDSSYTISFAEQSEWDDVQSFVDSFVTSDLAKSLSRYALKQMEAYTYIPGRDTQLELFGANDSNVVYEITLDELPSHARLVKRYLKLYIVGLRYDGKFLPNHFYLTIRGERFE